MTVTTWLRDPHNQGGLVLIPLFLFFVAGYLGAFRPLGLP